jgi:hypothetical protein
MRLILIQFYNFKMYAKIGKTISMNVTNKYLITFHMLHSRNFIRQFHVEFNWGFCVLNSLISKQ